MQLILVINRRTRIENYANKFSTLIPIKPLRLIVHGLCFLGVNVIAIECIHTIFSIMMQLLLFPENAVLFPSSFKYYNTTTKVDCQSLVLDFV